MSSATPGFKVVVGGNRGGDRCTVGLAGRNSRALLPRDATQGEDNDSSENAEDHDDDDEEFDQGETTELSTGHGGASNFLLIIHHVGPFYETRPA